MSTSYETAPAILAALADRLPGVTADTRLLSTSEILSGVADGTLDAGLVRCPPPTPELVRTLVRLEPQGVLMAAGHRLAVLPAVDPAELGAETVLIHPREANPGHYDAITAILDRAGAAPRLLLRALSFDAGHTPVARGEAVSVVGGSAAPSLPAGLVWRPLTGTRPSNSTCSPGAAAHARWSPGSCVRRGRWRGARGGCGRRGWRGGPVSGQFHARAVCSRCPCRRARSGWWVSPRRVAR